MTIKETLNNGINLLKENKIENPVLHAKMLLSYVLNSAKEYLLIHDNEEIEEKQIIRYNELIKKIIDNYPIQYITNTQEFMKLKMYVDENVLIPRADTEILVEEIINICEKNVNKEYHILDLCAGSGAIGIALAKYIKNCKIIGADIQNGTISVARKNATNNEVEDKISFINSNMFENIDGKFDIIVSNPPYIKSDIIKILDKNVQKEPHIALDGGDDGLKFYRIIANNAYEYLNENGYLCLEIGYDQKNSVIELLNNTNKYDNIYSKKDLYNNDRIIIAKLKK